MYIAYDYSYIKQKENRKKRGLLCNVRGSNRSLSPPLDQHDLSLIDHLMNEDISETAESIDISELISTTEPVQSTEPTTDKMKKIYTMGTRKLYVIVNLHMHSAYTLHTCFLPSSPGLSPSL